MHFAMIGFIYFKMIYINIKLNIWSCLNYYSLRLIQLIIINAHFYNLFINTEIDVINIKLNAWVNFVTLKLILLVLNKGT